jgi:hypothetical protein
MSREIYMLYRRSGPASGPLIIASTEDLGGDAVANVKSMSDTQRFQKNLLHGDKTANLKESLPLSVRENIYTLRWNNFLQANNQGDMGAKLNMRMLALANIYKYFVEEGYDVKLGYIDIVTKRDSNAQRRTSKSPGRQPLPDNIIAEAGEEFRGRGRKSPFTLNISENISKDLNQTFKTKRGGRVSVEIRSE